MREHIEANVVKVKQQTADKWTSQCLAELKKIQDEVYITGFIVEIHVDFTMDTAGATRRN